MTDIFTPQQRPPTGPVGGPTASDVISAGPPPPVSAGTGSPRALGVDTPADQAGLGRGGAFDAMRQGMLAPGDFQFQYTREDTFEKFRSSSAEYLWRLQQRLARAGLLQGDFRKGVWDEASRSAMEDAMALANQQQKGWTTVLKELEAAPLQTAEDGKVGPAGLGGGDLPSRREFIEPTFRPNDPASLAAAVKDMFQEMVGGREMDPEEVEQATGEFAALVRQAFEQDVEAQRNEFEIAESQRMSELLDSSMSAVHPAGTPTEAGTVPQTDPVARMRQIFEERFAPEIEHREAVDVTAENRQTLMGVLGSIDQAVGV